MTFEVYVFSLTMREQILSVLLKYGGFAGRLFSVKGNQKRNRLRNNSLYPPPIALISIGKRGLYQEESC